MNARQAADLHVALCKLEYAGVLEAALAVRLMESVDSYRREGNEAAALFAANEWARTLTVLPEFYPENFGLDPEATLDNADAICAALAHRWFFILASDKATLNYWEGWATECMHFPGTAVLLVDSSFNADWLVERLASGLVSRSRTVYGSRIDAAREAVRLAKLEGREPYAASLASAT